MLKITDVVKHLLIINVLLFLASQAIDTGMLALYYFQSPLFQPFQIVTHFFMHANLMHLFFNMFALVMFGSALEALWGPKRFLFFYFFCALGAAALHTFFNWYDFSSMQAVVDAFSNNPSYAKAMNFFKDNGTLVMNQGEFAQINLEYIEQFADQLDAGNTAAVQETSRLMTNVIEARMNIPTVGASGAVYGLLLAFGMLFPNAELMLIFLPIPIKAKYFIPILMVVELYLGINQFSWDNIAHFAHLGGALFGFLLILYWRKFGTNL